MKGVRRYKAITQPRFSITVWVDIQEMTTYGVVRGNEYYELYWCGKQKCMMAEVNIVDCGWTDIITDAIEILDLAENIFITCVLRKKKLARGHYL